MGLYNETWAMEIAAKLFPNDSFLRRSINDDGRVQNKRVNLQEESTIPIVTVNNNATPLAVTDITDTPFFYDMDDFRAGATRIEFLDEMRVTYNKRKSIINRYVKALQEKAASYAPYYWSPNSAANIVNTTGASRTASLVGAMGTRKGLTRKDLIAANKILDKLDIPLEGRCVLMSPDFYQDLMEDANLTNNQQNGVVTISNAAFKDIFGLEIFRRSKVGAYPTGSTSAKNPTALPVATDNGYCLVWHPDFVRFAKGAVKLFINEDQAIHQGTLVSALLVAGGITEYTSRIGTVAIVEVP